MQSGQKQITDKGAVLWGVSYDSAETLKKVNANLKITFPLLADEGSKTIEAFGVRNPRGKGRKDGVAIPMTLIISTDGVVKAKLAHDGVHTRHGVADIVAELDKL